MKFFFYLQQILSSLIRGRDQPQSLQDVNEDARRRLDQWYLQQVFNQYRQIALASQPISSNVTGIGLGCPTNPSTVNSATSGPAPMAPNPNHSLFMELNNLTNGNDTALAAAAAAGLHPSLAAAAAAAAAAQAVSSRTSGMNVNGSGNAGIGALVPNNSCNPEKSYGHVKQTNNSLTNHHSHNSFGSVGHGHHHSSSLSSSNNNSRTRIRTSFDPELELPKLHKWFAENRHPSRSQVQEYVRELNALESRKGRKPLDVNNVVYWFKNARAAHKRAELKFVSNDSNLSSHSFGMFNPNNPLANEFFGLNGGSNTGGGNGSNNGNNSPGKASSEASVSVKGNDDPMSNASRNGSNLDDYYSFDEDGDSREEQQTLDLSMRNSILCGSLSSKISNDSPRQQINNDESGAVSGGDDCDDLKYEEDEDEDEDENDQRHDVLSNVDNADHNPQSDQTAIRLDGGGGGLGSDCNSVDDESDDDNDVVIGGVNHFGSHHTASVAASLLSNAAALSSLNHANNHSAHHPDSPEGRRARRSRTFIDPLSEVNK